jgi:hypothetical protein
VEFKLSEKEIRKMKKNYLNPESKKKTFYNSPGILRKLKKKQIPENNANILQLSGIGKMLQSGMRKNNSQFSRK